MKIFTYLLVSFLSIIIATYIVPGIQVTFVGALVVAVVLGVINVFIKPVIKIITLPLTILTLGLFSLVLNALFILLASKIVPDFMVSGFWAAFWFGIVMSLVSAFLHFFEKKSE